MEGRESIEVARNIAVVALPLVLIATWLVRVYAPDDDEARFRHIEHIELVLLRVNVAVGFIGWLLAVLADPEHLGRNIGLMALGLCVLALFEGGRRLRQRRGRKLMKDSK